MSLFSPVHPGEILQVEFMEPLGLSQYRVAQATAVPPRRINEIVRGQRSISADTALRLARFFGTSEMFWLNLQARYDLDVQREKLGAALANVRPMSTLPMSAIRVAQSPRSRAHPVKSSAAHQRKAK